MSGTSKGGTGEGDESRFVEQPLPVWKRAVLKVGSSLLSAEGGLSPHHAVHLAAFVHAAHARGREVVIVSSGAVAAGRAVQRTLSNAMPQAGAAMAERQALAALGQAKLMAFWQGLLARPVAQVLLTHDDVRNRRRYLNARATLHELLRCGALPIVNENDTVSVDELKLGDNDTLGAIVAALIDADVLFIATDIDGLYDRDPRTHADAQPIQCETNPGDEVLAMAGGAGSAVGTGGMRTKILAAQRAGAAGVDTVLFNGTRAAVAQALGEDRLIGTRLVAGRSRIAARKHWLRHAPVEAGAAILVDAGAARALSAKGASLLPIGVVGAQGEFRRGDLVDVVLAEAVLASEDLASAGVCASTNATKAIARGVSQYSAADLRRIAGKRSQEIDAILGYNYGDSIVHRDDLSLYATHAHEATDV
jgi:glutamate 5-kinase